MSAALLDAAYYSAVAERRQFSPWVDLKFYLVANPDVNQAFKGDRHVNKFEQMRIFKAELLTI